jgi:hypothetical protein
MFALEIDDFCAVGGLNVGAELRDAAVGEHDCAPLDDRTGNRMNDGVGKCHRASLLALESDQRRQQSVKG